MSLSLSLFLIKKGDGDLYLSRFFFYFHSLLLLVSLGPSVQPTFTTFFIFVPVDRDAMLAPAPKAALDLFLCAFFGLAGWPMHRRSSQL